MTNKFSNYSLNVTGYPSSYLPLVHTTDWKKFNQLMDAGTVLIAPECDVFPPERISYLFYGRPSFKVHMGLSATSNEATDSVCLIFETESVPSPKRIYPFDSGAFHLGLYEKFHHPEDKKEQFEIHPNFDSVKKFVGKYFETNKNYFKENFRPDLNPPITELEARTYIDIASARSQTPFDSRKSSLEIQVDGNLDLLVVNVLAVIVNEDVLDDPKVVNFIENTLGAESIGYFSPHAAPEEQALLMMNLAKNWYEKRGLL